MENVVTFEIAKKLKDRRFKEKCFAYYNDNMVEYNFESKMFNCELFMSHNSYDNIWHKDYIDAPTISQVLEWLFNEKQLFVNIDCNICDNFGLFFTIYKKGEESWVNCGFNDDYYNTPEEASIGAIEYILDNLI